LLGLATLNQNSNEMIFKQRLDFYIQAGALYIAVLFIYIFFRSFLMKDDFEINLEDPILILLSVFIFGSFLSFLLKYWRDRTIVIGNDFIVFRTRFREKKYGLKEIERIIYKTVHNPQLRETMRIIKVRVQGRKRLIRIRPSQFWDDSDLYNAIVELAQKTKNK